MSPAGHHKLQPQGAAGFSPPPCHLSTVMYVPCLSPLECEMTGVSRVGASGGRAGCASSQALALQVNPRICSVCNKRLNTCCRVSLGPSQASAHVVFLQFIMKRNGGQPAPGTWLHSCPCKRLLVQPVPSAILPTQELIRPEPERDLAAGVLHRVAAVDHVPAREGSVGGPAGGGGARAAERVGRARTGLTCRPPRRSLRGWCRAGRSLGPWHRLAPARRARRPGPATPGGGASVSAAQGSGAVPARGPRELTMATTGPELMYLTRRP